MANAPTLRSTESEDENGDVVESFGSAASAEGAVEGTFSYGTGMVGFFMVNVLHLIGKYTSSHLCR